MNMRISGTLGLLMVCGSVFCAGCPSEKTTIPTANLDKAPNIIINGFAVGNSGASDIANTNISRTVHVFYGTRLMVSGSAENQTGGVRSFQLAFSDWGAPQAELRKAGPDALRRVPTILRILGHDYRDGRGVQPFIYTFDNYAADLHVSGTATNFNGMKQQIDVHYVVTPDKPHVDSLTRIPADGRIAVGGSATVEWQTTCNATTCTVKIEGTEGDGKVVLKMNGVPLNGSFNPTGLVHDTKYKVTISNSSGSDSKEVWITPRASQIPVPVMYYYFRVTSSSNIRPCYTVAIPAPDEASAEAIAQNQDVGATVTQISYQEFSNGCGG